VHYIAGAFFAGFALASFPVRGLIESQVSSLSDFFVALFFVALGTAITFPTPDGILLA
jgi:Kef-type K+ transport system membrane component KefB